MKNTTQRILMLSLCTLLFATIALAVPKDHGKGKEKDRKAHESREEISESTALGIFVERDRDLIRNHFGVNRGNLPPGLAKRGGDLPPGLAKQLQRNGHLPPGLEKKVEPFPIELERRLPPLKPGLARGIIAGSAVIINTKTRVILDVFAIF
jgi:hypothetical protein